MATRDGQKGQKGRTVLMRALRALPLRLLRRVHGPIERGELARAPAPAPSSSPSPFGSFNYRCTPVIGGSFLQPLASLNLSQ